MAGLSKYSNSPFMIFFEEHYNRGCLITTTQLSTQLFIIIVLDKNFDNSSLFHSIIK